MKRRTLAVVALTLVAGAVFTVALVPATCQAQGAKVTSLSRSSAKVGARLTIRGSNFGSRQGRSSVTFGERPNLLHFAPCSKRARVIAWSSSSITVRVPGLAPGSHGVYVTVGGRASKAHPFSITPRRTISNRTFVTSSDHGYWVPSEHDVLYDGCTFTATNPNLAGFAYGVVTLGCEHSDQRITFLNCTFTGNTGVGSGLDYGVNGVKVWGENVDDISFVKCTFGQFSRMGYEQVNGTAAHAAQRIGFYGCVFEPCGAEPLSNNSGDLYQLVAGCTFEGSGNSTGSGEYGGTIECNNGHYLEVRNCHMWSFSGGGFNFQGVEGVDPHILVENTDVDVSHTYQTATPAQAPGGTVLFGMHNISYVRFAGCTFNTGSYANHVQTAGWAAAGNDSSWWSCSHIDFRGSTITGYISQWQPYIPSTGRGYWDAPANQTNIWPTRVR